MSGTWSSHSAFPFDAPAQTGARRHRRGGQETEAPVTAGRRRLSRKVRRAGQEVAKVAGQAMKAGQVAEKVAGQAMKAGQEAAKVAGQVEQVASALKTAGRRMKKTAKKVKAARRH